MALPSEPHRRRRHHNNHIATFLQSTASNFASLFNPPNPPSLTLPHPPSSLSLPLLFAPPLSASNALDSTASTAEPARPAAKSVSVARLGANGKGGSGGPAFVGQVFSMCDLSGTGLMAVSTHFDIPFISKRFLPLF